MEHLSVGGQGRGPLGVEAAAVGPLRLGAEARRGGDEDKTADALGVSKCEKQRQPPPHRVADHVGLTVERRPEAVGGALHRVGRLGEADRLAEAREVGRAHVPRGGEALVEGGPVGPAAEKAVQQERRRAHLGVAVVLHQRPRAWDVW